MTGPSSSFETVSPSEVQASRNNALLLDVRTQAEFTDAHIEGAHLSPLQELNPSDIAHRLQGKTSCILICGSGNRARKAADALCAAGVSRLCVMEGGMKAWQAQGLPVVEGKTTISLERQVRIAAGSLVLLGAILGYFVNPTWIGLPAFVGAGLVFAGVTDTCGMALLLARMPWNTTRHCSSNEKPPQACSL